MRLAPKDPWPAAVQDVASAIAWVHANIAKYGGDPDRVVLLWAEQVTAICRHGDSGSGAEPDSAVFADSGFDPEAFRAFVEIARGTLSQVSARSPAWVHLLNRNYSAEGMSVGTRDVTLTDAIERWLGEKVGLGSVATHS